MCIRHHGAVRLYAGDPETGRREIAEGLTRCQPVPVGAAWGDELLGVAAFVLGESARRHRICFESPASSRPGRPAGACHALVDLALTLRHEGKLTAALNAYRNACATSGTIGSRPRVPTPSKVRGDRGRDESPGWPRSCPGRPRDGERPISRNRGPDAQRLPRVAANVRRRLGERAWFEACEAGRS